MNITASQPTARLDYLDAVRGLAALVVLWNHYAVAFGFRYFSPLLDSPLGLLLDPRAALMMFFVLSGYVLSYRYLDAVSMRQFRLGTFWLKRVCRIVLPFIAFLVLSMAAREFLYSVVEGGDPSLTAWGQRHWAAERVELPVVEYLKTALMILPDTQFPLIPQAWTLRIEMGMSLLLPFMLLVACRSSWWLVLFTLVGIALLEIYIFMAHFTLGILLARYRAPMCEWLRGRALPTLGLLAVGLWLYGYRYAPEWITPKLSLAPLGLANGVGSAVLLLLVFASPRAQKILQTGALRFIGRVSYSTYLVHLAVILTASQHIVHWMSGLGLAPAYTFWLGMAFTTLLTLGIAGVCYRVIEMPCIDLGRFLAAHLDRRRPASQTREIP